LRWLWRDWPAEGELDVLLSPHALLCTASVPVSEIVGIFALAKPWLIFEVRSAGATMASLTSR
jgi:hypothetical protein